MRAVAGMLTLPEISMACVLFSPGLERPAIETVDPPASDTGDPYNQGQSISGFR